MSDRTLRPARLGRNASMEPCQPDVADSQTKNQYDDWQAAEPLSALTQ
jgi:hypothetical protein